MIVHPHNTLNTLYSLHTYNMKWHPNLNNELSECVQTIDIEIYI